MVALRLVWLWGTWDVENGCMHDVICNVLSLEKMRLSRWVTAASLWSILPPFSRSGFWGGLASRVRERSDRGLGGALEGDIQQGECVEGGIEVR